MFAGSWTLDGDMKPSAMGPGGKMTENEKCEWMEGGFFMVCHADFKSSMGNGSGLTLMGYSPDDKSYTYREFNSWGEFTDSKGTVDGDTWTWINDEKMGGMTMKGRFKMKIDLADVVQLQLRDVAGWNEVDDGDGWEGDQGKVIAVAKSLPRGAGDGTEFGMLPRRRLECHFSWPAETATARSPGWRSWSRRSSTPRRTRTLPTVPSA